MRLLRRKTRRIVITDDDRQCRLTNGHAMERAGTRGHVFTTDDKDWGYQVIPEGGPRCPVRTTDDSEIIIEEES